MTKKNTAAPAPGTPPPLITLDRALRLGQLVRLLGLGNQSRATLLTQLQLDVRGFYRDLQTLREVGIEVEVQKGVYRLKTDVEQALHRLPFPFPPMSVGEALRLSKGRTQAHRQLQEQLAKILPPA